MTNNGLERTDIKEENGEDQPAKSKTNGVPNTGKVKFEKEVKHKKPEYRYNGTDTTPVTKPDSSNQQKEISQSDPTEETQTYPSLIYMLIKLAR
jgi:hypothetical protein